MALHPSARLAVSEERSIPSVVMVRVHVVSVGSPLPVPTETWRNCVDRGSESTYHGTGEFRGFGANLLLVPGRYRYEEGV